MNTKKLMTYIFIGLLFICIVSLAIYLTNSINSDNNCHPSCNTDENCINKKCIPDNKCHPPCNTDENCINKKCIPDDKCHPPCNNEYEYCFNKICYSNEEYPTIKEQPRSSIQIINNTSEKFLHVFLQLNNKDDKQWGKLLGNGKIYPPVNWNETVNGNIGGNAFEPLGAKLATEAIIPKDGFIILQLPPSHPPAFVIMALKMTHDDDRPLVLEDGSPSNRKGDSK